MDFNQVDPVGIFDSISYVTDWIDVLMGLNDGDRTYEECIERLGEL